MQHHTYPLPPLFLTEVLERAKDDHTHKCDEFCTEFDGRYCTLAENEQLLDVPTIVEILPGNGRHECDAHCKTTSVFPNCMTHCDDSDWIVEVCYSRKGWHAIYGVKRAGDVQDVSLWAD